MNGHGPSIRISVHAARTRSDPPRTDAPVRAGPGFGERPVPAHLALGPAEGSAEDPEGDPDDARPRAGDNRDEPDGSAGSVLHRGRCGGSAAAPARPTGDGRGAVRVSAARTRVNDPPADEG